MRVRRAGPGTTERTQKARTMEGVAWRTQFQRVQRLSVQHLALQHCPRRNQAESTDTDRAVTDVKVCGLGWDT